VDGGITAVIGANGAGKTTLFSAVAGLIRPQSGTVGITYGRGRRGIGLLPQSPIPTPLLSAQSYVEYFGLLAGLNQRRVARAATVALQQVGLADRAKQRTSALSGGMFRRLCLAAAIVADPAVVLLDEPTVGLDPVARVRFRELVKTLASERTVLIATHLLDDVEALADRALVLNGRRLVFDGSLAQLRASSGVVAAAGAGNDVESALIAMLGSADDG
jgi:ABC-2 type transport system ATP-binding protein